MPYADRTKVPTMKSIHEVQSLVSRIGATSFGWAHTPESERFQFDAAGRTIRVEMALPAGRMDRAERERETNRRWREVVLLVRAKVVAVESGLVTLEDEWLPYCVTESGETVAEVYRRQHALPASPLALNAGEQR